MEQAALARMRPVAHGAARSDKEVHLAVAVVVGGTDSAGELKRFWQRTSGGGGEVALAIVEIEAVALLFSTGFKFIGSAGDEEVQIAITVRV